MKSTKSELRLPVAALLLLLSFGGAAAYYDPGPQRWLKRDAIADFGSAVLQGRLAMASSRTTYLFRFSMNSPIDFYDPLGLKAASHPRSPQDDKKLRGSLKDACEKFEDPNKCKLDCLRKTLPNPGGDPAYLALADIRKFCKNKVDNGKVSVECDYNNSSGDFKTGDYGDHDSTITFCKPYFDGTTAKTYGYNNDCVAIHEIAHWGFGTSGGQENGACTYNKCFGCPGTTH